jgi:hypothetical protein
MRLSKAFKMREKISTEKDKLSVILIIGPEVALECIPTSFGSPSLEQ